MTRIGTNWLRTTFSTNGELHEWKLTMELAPLSQDGKGYQNLLYPNGPNRLLHLISENGNRLRFQQKLCAFVMGAFQIVVFIPFRFIQCIGNPREQGRCICGAFVEHLWSNGASSIVGSRDIQQWGNQQWGLPHCHRNKNDDLECTLCDICASKIFGSTQKMALFCLASCKCY
jgi:hypothetical protein